MPPHTTMRPSSSAHGDEKLKHFGSGMSTTHCIDTGSRRCTMLTSIGPLLWLVMQSSSYLPPRKRTAGTDARACVPQAFMSHETSRSWQSERRPRKSNCSMAWRTDSCASTISNRHVLFAVLERTMRCSSSSTSLIDAGSASNDRQNTIVPPPSPRTAHATIGAVRSPVPGHTAIASTVSSAARIVLALS